MQRDMRYGIVDLTRQRSKEVSMAATVASVVPVKGEGARSLPRGERELVSQIEEALELLQGKWKVHLVFLLARGVHRHCRLLESLPGISKKMMTETLRALERDGLVTRRIFAEVPLRVEYSLTALGWSVTAPLLSLAEWYEDHGPDVREARASYRRGSA
jgi:DNA-binding HxlR family transcriptional regulator